ncbi:membrane protein [Sporolactobacillus inulinus]|uniref:Membrane protein n=1 Tax=Sporolactobacillus inulinus TaxID=2078 RepID=A0A4Y1ZBY9_9BACL|nr:nucleoside recognition domain-containing protein [Sporolactobacillus inulinus]GAY76451.1 membrane protein [Sporolactobacillus inulinus]
MNQSKTFTYLLAAGSVALVALMVCYPEVAVGGSIKGLTIWWNQVFPALFPFFVLAELMISFGVVNFAGILMEPLMRPIFRLPGIGGFVLMMGVVSGFPAGARITADLYKDKKLTKSEAERLASFTNFSNPLFIFSVTAVQFFHQASLGIIFALSHYFGNLCVGLTMRFFSNSKKGQIPSKSARDSFMHLSVCTKSVLRTISRSEKNRRCRRVIGYDTLGNWRFHRSFSMLYQLFLNIGAINLLGEVLSICFKWIGFSPELGSAVIPGLFELTIGDKSVAELTSVPLIEQVVVVSGLLGFCGFSIQAQAVSILSQAGLSSRLFLIGRILQMIYSSIAAFLLFHVFSTNSSTVETTTAFSQNLSVLTHRAVFWGPTLTFVVLIIFILLQLHRVCSHSHHLNG